MNVLVLYYLLCLFSNSIAVDELSNSHSFNTAASNDASIFVPSREREPSASPIGAESITEVKPKKKRKSSMPGYQTNKNKVNRRLVGFLAQRGNGITNHITAKKAAEATLDKEREYNRLKMQRYRKSNPPKIKNSVKPPGYASRAATIERNMRLISKKDKTLSDDKVRKLAEEKYMIATAKKSAQTAKFKQARKMKKDGL